MKDIEIVGLSEKHKTAKHYVAKRGMGFVAKFILGQAGE